MLMRKNTLILFATLALLSGAVLAFGADQPIWIAVFSTGLFLTASAAVIFISNVSVRWVGLFGLGLAVLSGLAIVEVLQGRWEQAQSSLLAMAASGAVFLLGRILTRTREDSRQTFKILVWMLAGMAILFFVDFILLPDAIFGRTKVFHEDRLTASFLSANTAATFFAVSLVVGVAGVLRAIRRASPGPMGTVDAIGQRGIGAMVLTIFAMTCLVLTASRAGLAVGGCGAVALILWARAGKWSKRSLIWTSGLGIVLLGLIWLVSGSVGQERLTDLGLEGSDRDILWAACLAAWKEAPLFGHGLGQFQQALAPHITQDTAPVLIFQGAAHNLVLQWLIQAGAVGVAAGGVLWGSVLWMLCQSMRQHHLTIWRQAIFICVGMVFTHGMVDYALEIPAILWWTAFLVGAGAGLNEQEELKKSR